MRIDRLSIWVALVALGCVVAMPAWALDGPSTPPLRAESETSGEAFEMIAFEGEVAATASTCLGFGEFDDLHAGTDRYRGNRFRIETEDVELVEIRIELRFRGTVDLYYSIHRSEAGSESPSYERVIDFPDVIVTASGDGVAEFYSSGLLDGLILERGYDYAIGVSWTETDNAVNGAVTYGRDELQYPIPFLHGQVMGPVASNSPPPMADDLGNLEGFSELAYSMELCFAPVDGACCCWELYGSVCAEMLESDCIGAGCHFFGERVQCNEIVCDFGACCFPCGECGDNYTAEACEADGGSKHWSNMACIDPDAPDELCPEIIGACCAGDTCLELCLDDCMAIGGEYRGDDTNCDPNICVGACCFEGGCAELTGSFCEWPFGVYRGDGTECATLPPDLECGGACCWTIGTVEGCQDVANRAECTIAGGVSEPLYAGAGTQCIDEPCSHLGTCSGDVTLLCGTDDECLGICNLVPSVLCIDDQECVDEEAGTRCIGYSGGTCNLFQLGSCCLPDGTCLFTTEDACAAEVPGGGDFTPDDGSGSEMCEPPTSCVTKPCCFRDGTCQVLTESACLGLGEIPAGDVIDTCDDVSCSDVLTKGACCGMAAGVCNEVPEVDCLAADGVFLGDWTTCPNALCVGFGACCREEDGECFDDYTSDECGVVGGVYKGDGSTCDTLDPQCDQRGACCTERAKCLFVLEAECLTITGTAAGDGVFKGVGVQCESDTCPTGACCFDGTCEVIGGEAYCKAVGYVYQGDDTDCEEPGICTIGACCFDDGGCEDRVESECPVEEGMFHAEFTCAADLCEPIGACCKRDGGCLDDVKESECASICGELTAEALCNTLDPPCTPIGACCYADATCGSPVRQIDCEANGNVFTVGADCSDIPSCEGRGACCEGGDCHPDMTFPDCEFLGGVYMDDETACYPGLCAEGACCHLDGNCDDDQILSQCEEPNDEFSYGLRCENISCPARGACCVGEEGGAVCQLMTFAECYDASGDYEGHGTLCIENLCQTVACCTVAEACTNVPRYMCERDGGAYMGADFVCTGPTPDDPENDPACKRGACCEPDETCSEWKVQSECKDPDDFRLWEGCTQCEGRGACCLPDDPGGEFCQIFTRAECLDNYGTYAGDGSVCQPDDLCSYGACCMPFGMCDIRTRHSCETAEGIYHGADTECASLECILGACCLPDETCETQTEPHCEEAEGTYLGVNTDCLDVNCTLGSCCYLNGNFAVTVQSECAGAEDTFEAGLTCGDPAWCKPRGACCEGDTCTILPQAQCEAGGNTYLGNGVLCEPDTCLRPGDMVDSSPENCLIDARQPSQTDGTEPAGWSVKEITFTSDASSLIPEDFTVRVEPGPATVPVITAVVPTGTPETVALELDGPIPTGQWTCFTYVHSGSEVCLGYLPADADGDGTAAPSDILRVIDCLNAVATCGTHQCDIDRSLVCGPPDILRVIDLLNGAGVYDAWVNVSLPTCPSAP